MPAWKRALPPDEIWKLVAYIQSLGGTVSVSNYEHARQGDRPGDLIAPEAQAEAQP
jgi:mono/diheme cytochrome c family protein